MPVFVLSFLLFIIAAGCGSLPAEHVRVTPTDGAIRIPAAEVKDGKVHFYTYKKSGKRINFFIRTDGRGELSAYFDACLTCYRHKKGYRTEGTDLVCNECGMKFRLADEIWDNSQGCSPIKLRSRIDRDFISIKAADAERGSRLF